jgi:hypothetical protein
VRFYSNFFFINETTRESRSKTVKNVHDVRVAQHPDPVMHEAPDAGCNWNALSLPFVVGPHGRIGKMDPKALNSPPQSFPRRAEL